MFEIEVNEVFMEAIEELKLENVRYENKISENTPIMNDYFRGVIRRNNEMIEKYTELGIKVISRREA